MEFNTTFLLTKSYQYDGSFLNFNNRLFELLKDIKNDPINEQNTIELFKEKHSGVEVVFKPTNKLIKSSSSFCSKLKNVNFVVYSISKDLFKHHFSQQIKERVKDLEKSYLKKYSDIKKQFEEGKIEGSYLRVVIKNIISICEGISDKKASKKKTTEKIEKYNEILKLLTYVKNESERKELADFSILGDFIKTLRRFIDYLTISNTNVVLSRLKDFNIIVGKNNVINISIVGIKDISITEGNRNYDSFVARAYRDSSGINSILDNCSLLFSIFDINKLLNNKKKELVLVESNLDVKRVTFSKCLYNERFFKQIWEGNNENNVKQEIANYKYYYSLMSTNMAFYKDIPFTNQIEIVKNQIQLNYYSLDNNKFFDNYNNGAYDNFLISTNTFVITESAQTNIEVRTFIDNYPDDYKYNEWFLFKVADNHKIRFSAFIDAEIICTSVVYSSMCVLAHNIFRSGLLKFNHMHSHFSRMLVAHNISREYSKMNACYSSHGPFIKNEKNAKAQIVFNKMGLTMVEKETDDLLRNVWQESNITNGKVFPFIQAVAAIVTVVCAIISYTFVNTNKKMSLSFSYVSLALLIGLLCFSFVYYLISISRKK